jgi:hypothetical protein
MEIDHHNYICSLIVDCAAYRIADSDDHSLGVSDHSLPLGIAYSGHYRSARCPHLRLFFFNPFFKFFISQLGDLPGGVS